MAVFDALGYLSNYLKDAHKVGRHHLADLYELVQYAGNIVPRLYLMITVGSVYMGLDGAPVKEIMRDMMEMSRGVQHPIRGLFLRHYLSGQTRDYLPIGSSEGPIGNLQDSIQFTLTNFIEMNKLWVRLQHQGHSRERQTRELERTELKTLVGTNLVRLSQLDGIELETYTDVILPAVLEQIIQCRDVLAQEYLLEVITQVYPDDYHLRTLGQFLSAIAKLNPHVNVKQIVIQIIDRLATFALREAENEDPLIAEEKEKIEAQKLSQKVSQLRVRDDPSSDPRNRDESAVESADKRKEDAWSEKFRGIPTDIQLFEIFWTQIIQLVKVRSDLNIQDISAMLVSLSNLALNCYPAHLEYIDQILGFANEKAMEKINTTDLHSPEAQGNLLGLLIAPIKSYKNFLTIFALQAYMPFFHTQTYAIRRVVATTIAEALLSHHVIIDNQQDAEGLFDLLKVLFVEEASPQGNGARESRRTKDIDSDEFVEEQSLVAKVLHFLRNDDLDTQLELLQIARRSLAEGGERIKYTYPALVMNLLRLARQCKSKEHIHDGWSEMSSAIYKYVHSTITTLYERSGGAEAVMKLFLFAGQVADQGGFEEIAYEFFAQAFTIYEEAISESRAQYQAVAILASALQQTRSFSRDNYDTLITKCALHGAKLLKKPDQTRAILSASHLWWATDISARGEEDDKTIYRDDKRVLECLQKALKIADACMDTATSIQLFVEILDTYIYYYDRQNEAVSDRDRFLERKFDICRLSHVISMA